MAGCKVSLDRGLAADEMAIRPNAKMVAWVSATRQVTDNHWVTTPTNVAMAPMFWFTYSSNGLSHKEK